MNDKLKSALIVWFALAIFAGFISYFGRTGLKVEEAIGVSAILVAIGIIILIVGLYIEKK